jgi:hypothetical protein
MANISPLGVFINCPFDPKYKKFFEALVFAIIRCGFVARSALEIDDGGGPRIEKIMRLIEECPYGIHDISRTELDTKTRLPRFNMPLELGIFLGARRYGSAVQKNKLCLILDRDRFRYQRFMSDISGQDIHSHERDISRIITLARDFLRTIGAHVPGGDRIFQDFQNFQKDKIRICQRLDLDWKKLTFHDQTYVIAEWISQQA